MKMHRKNGYTAKHLFWILTLCTSFLLTGCGNEDTAGTQARTDLTSDHVRGLYSGMLRNDIEDLLGTSDKSLGEKESVEVYGLSDGSTAILRYSDDKLMGAYLRDKENNETSLFDGTSATMPGVNGINSTDSSLESSQPHPTPEESSNLDSSYTQDIETDDSMTSATDRTQESNENESR